MSLPVSSLAPTPAPRLISPDSYKPSIEVNIPGLDKDLSNLVCGSVFNTLALKSSTNRLRTFTYNLMAKGEYKSQEFIDLCNYAGNYAVSEFIKDKKHRQDQSIEKDTELKNITSTIHTKVPDAITLWMSTLLAEYPELEYEIGSSLAHKTKQLVSRYQNSLKEIQSMSLDPQAVALLAQMLSAQNNNSNQGNAASVLAALGGNNDRMVQVKIGNNIVNMPMSQALALKAQAQQQQGGMDGVLAALGIGGSPVNVGGFSGGGGLDLNAIAKMLGGNNDNQAINLGGITSDSGYNSTAQIGNTGGNQLLNKWRKDRGEATDVVTDVEIGTISKSIPQDNPELMSSTSTSPVQTARAPKAITSSNFPNYKPLPFINTQFKSEDEHNDSELKVLGFPVFKQTAGVYSDLREEIIQVVKAIPEAPIEIGKIEKKEGDNTEVEPVAVSTPVRISNAVIHTNTVTGFIRGARKFVTEQTKEFPETSNQIVVNYGIASNSFTHADEEAYSIIKSITDRANGSIQKMRARMESVVTGISEVAKKGKSLKDPDVRSIVTSLESLDRWFTTVINDFLLSNFNTTVSMESFTYDFNEIETFISNKFGAEGTAWLDSYLEDVMCSFREGLRKDIPFDTVDNTSFFTETCISIAIPYTFSDLGINLTSQSRYLDPKKCPTMTDLCKLFHNVAEKFEWVAMNKYIITADGIAIRVQNSVFQEDGKGFILSTMNGR